MSVKAKNSQFPDVEAVSYSGALEFRVEPGLVNECEYFFVFFAKASDYKIFQHIKCVR